MDVIAEIKEQIDTLTDKTENTNVSTSLKNTDKVDIGLAAAAIVAVGLIGFKLLDNKKFRKKTINTLGSKKNIPLVLSVVKFLIALVITKEIETKES